MMQSGNPSSNSFENVSVTDNNSEQRKLTLYEYRRIAIHKGAKKYVLPGGANGVL